MHRDFADFLPWFSYSLLFFKSSPPYVGKQCCSDKHSLQKRVCWNKEGIELLVGCYRSDRRPWHGPPATAHGLWQHRGRERCPRCDASAEHQDVSGISIVIYVSELFVDGKCIIDSLVRRTFARGRHLLYFCYCNLLHFPSAGIRRISIRFLDYSHWTKFV